MHQDSQSNPTFGNRYQQNTSFAQLKALHQPDQDEPEVKRLNALVEAQRKIISQMQNQLKAEREKNKRVQEDQEQFSPNNEMRVKTTPRPQPQADESNNIDIMCDIYRQRQKEWNRFKHGTGKEPPSYISTSVKIRSSADNHPDLDPIINITPKLANRATEILKLKSSSKSKGSRSLNTSASKVSMKSTKRPLLNRSIDRVRSSGSSSKAFGKTKDPKSVTRRLSTGSATISVTSKARFKKKKKKDTIKKPTSSIMEKQAKNAIFKVIQEDPAKASRFITQLVDLVSEKIKSHPTAVPLKPVKTRKSINKTIKKGK